MNIFGSSEKFKGASALFGAALIYALFGLLIREMAKMYGDYSQVAVRFVLAFVLIFILNRFFKKTTKLARSELIKSIILGLIFAFAVVFFTISITQTKIANTVFLLYAMGMITSLLIGTALLKEKLTSQKILAIVIALVGLAMYSNVILVLNVGIITGILSGFFDGVSNSIRKTLKGADRNNVLQWQFFASAFLASTVTLFASEPIIKDVGILPIIVTVIFVLLQIKLGDLLLYGFQHFDVNTGTIILATELFFASLIGAVCREL